MNEDEQIISIFGPNPVLGTFKGVNYSDFLLDLKLNNPEEYHKLDLLYLKQLLDNNSNDFSFVKDLEGNIHRVLNIKGLSGSDPVGLFYVEGVALGPVFKGIGRAAEYGLAKAGNNWARARIVSRALNNNVNRRLVTAAVTPRVEILNHSTTITDNPSLKFFERPLSKLTPAERIGVPKGGRNLKLKTNPLAGVLSEVNTYLINRTNTPLLFVDGKLVWMPGNGRAGTARKTIHFTTDLPVTGHSGGNWDGVSETVLTPYKLVVYDNGNPMNIEPMDTYFSNQYPFILRLKGTKVFTGNPINYRRYKAQGVEAYTSKEALEALSKIRELLKESDRRMKALNNYNLSIGGKLEYWGVASPKNMTPEQKAIQDKLAQDALYDYEFNTLLQEAKNVYDAIQRSWARSMNNPTIETYRTMEAETGLNSGVREFTNGNSSIDYYTAPTSHSNSWFFDILEPLKQFDLFLDYTRKYPQAITELDWQMFELLVRKYPEITKKYTLDKLKDKILSDDPRVSRISQIIYNANAKQKPIYLKKLGGKLNKEI